MDFGMWGAPGEFLDVERNEGDFSDWGAPRPFG